MAYGERLAEPTNPSDSVIGEVSTTKVEPGESLLEIARQFDIGHDQIILANPSLNRWIPDVGATVTIPSSYILPPGPREGIVLNLAELRLYYFDRSAHSIYTFPVSIGDLDWRTPLGKTHVAAKQRNPTWYPPRSIREEHAEEGDDLPHMIPGGDPDNPLGLFALKLGIPGYLIHGTNDRRSFGIGMRVSHGCIRLYPENIAELFDIVKVGTPVRIIDLPVKVGWLGDDLYVEIHRPLELPDEPTPAPPTIPELVDTLRHSLRKEANIDIPALARAYHLGNGIPTKVGEATLSAHGF